MRASGARTIAVNDQYLVAPWADILYFADTRWWEWHHAGLEKKWPWVRFSAEQVRTAFARFAGQKVTIDGTGMMVPDPDVFMLHNDGVSGKHDGLTECPNALRTGSNGGYQAVNLAVLAGAKRVLLLGYDMRFPDGRSHSHNGHPSRHPETNYSQYAKHFATMLPDLVRLGVEVINCTPGSAIQCFPVAALESVLACAPSA